MGEIKTVSVLGSEWVILQRTPAEDKYLERVFGYADHTSNEIVYYPMPHDGIPECELCANLDAMNKRVIRHELVHAFFFESGLANDSEWAMNEAMVDWIARQFPKMLKAFQEAGAI
jgi:hypothetical protein